ncbi:DUF4132 domain-containing protein [Catenuloplanes sp. NPDC051500]|uniref:DUF4132 domain-containing protein n=1 Tax=Catenuloplanes sp. NPDC051500 TaxID=3363959 RepID=UPI003787C11F
MTTDGVPGDEDTFVMQPAWLRAHYPRRGESGLKPRHPEEAKTLAVVAELVSASPGKIRKVLEHPLTAPAIAEAGLAYHRDQPGSTPLGAAAVVQACHHVMSYSQAEKLPFYADVWLARHGLRFAAEAVVELSAMHIGNTQETIRSLHFLDVADPRFTMHRKPLLDLAGRVRHALATAPEAEYREVVAVLAEHRERGSVLHRAATSFLAPSETAWVEADSVEVAATGSADLALVTLTALGTREQADRITPLIVSWWLLSQPAVLHSFLSGVRGGALPALLTWLDTDAAEYAKRFLPAIGSVPTDEAFEALLDRADERYVLPEIQAAATRFPRRAIRLLAARPAGKRTLAELLDARVLAEPELASDLLPDLPDGSAARVRAVLARAEGVNEAPPESLPQVLVSPPWAGKRTVRKPTVVTGLECTDPPALDWAPGEAEAWSGVRFEQMSWVANHDWAATAATAKRGGNTSWYRSGPFFALAPLSLTLPEIGTWKPRDLWQPSEIMRRVVARHAMAAYPAALAAAQEMPQATDALLPFTSPAVATLIADRYTRLKSVRATALAWLQRHPVSAARALVPAAVGKAGPERRSAEASLLAIVSAGYAEEVRMAARSYGDAAATEIEPLITTSPLERLPARIPVVPAWADAALLPRLRTAGGALPADAVRHVLTMLALSRLSEPYPGLDLVRGVVDRRGLGEFAWALFRRWQAAGMPSKESWAFEALAHFGDDEVVRDLTPVIRAWPGEGGHARAVTGLEILSAIGSDVALMHLHGIAQKAKFKGLKDRATEKMAEVAAALELRPEQLADRLLPDFGLDGNGSLTLDYGPRRFVVGFDEQLKPFVAEESGRRLKALPKPGARDDAEMAPEAYRRFSGLKKDVRTVGGDQVRRLEQSMVTGRRWTGLELTRYLVGHPLLVHIVRRVVWGVYEKGELAGTFRVAEDRSFADVDDAPVTVADDALVGVVHPMTLGSALPAWSGVFADYEILQPFPQLGRELFRLEPGEGTASELTRFKDVKVPTTKLLGLERRGWRRGETGDGGHQGWFERDLPDDRIMVVVMDPGIAVGAIDYFPEQRLDEVRPQGAGDSYWSSRKSTIKLGDLDEITISEVIRELNEVTA